MVNIKIDGREISCDENKTILEIARENGVDIPSLCYLKEINEVASCRVCCVEVKGMDRLIPSCHTKPEEGMEILTNTPRVLSNIKLNLELILSEHKTNCTQCTRKENCTLKALAARYNITDVPYKKKFAAFRIKGFPVERDNSKCIKCLRCIDFCNKVQGMGVWTLLGTGEHTRVGLRPGLTMEENCTFCGQCITHCPVGALSERDDTRKVIDALKDEKKITVVQIAPAVRTAWADDLGCDLQFATEKRMVAAVKSLGFDYVFDTNFTADLTIMEEANELIYRIQNGGTLPMFTSCCPGWVKFMKSEYPELSGNLSTAKSPQQMFGAVVKSYFAEKIGVDPKNIFCVSVMPCVAKKGEAALSGMNDACGDPDVDAVLTTRELARMLKAGTKPLEELEEAEFDSPLGTSTGAAVIFGVTGGVLEAALRTGYKALTGNNPLPDAFTMVRGNDGRRTAELDINGLKLRVAVTSGLANARKLIEDVKSGKAQYDFIEIMACPGGCVGGGGQPIRDGEERAEAKGKALYKLDEYRTIRFSHENPDILAVYDEYLGEPLGEKSHHLLHVKSHL